MKLAPNFSWQKYADNDLTNDQQFEYQLQQSWIQIANSINTTINDLSFWTRERPTDFTWIDQTPIFTKTFTGVISVAPGDSVVNHGITGLRTLISIEGTIQDAIPLAILGLPVPYVDPVTPADSIGISVTPTTFIIRTASATWLNYTYNITMKYTKERV